MKFKFLLYILPFFFLFSQSGFSQRKKEKIKLIETGSNGALEKVKRGGRTVQKISGSRVVFQQENTFYYCQEAYFDKKKNHLEALGNVKITSDSLVITGNRLDYDGKTKVAQLRGKVVLVEKQMTLYTENLDYNLSNNTANYFEGGRILDNGNVLTSRNGFYNKMKHFFHFTNNVKLVGQDATLYANDLTYDLDTKIAKTKGETTIIGKKGEKSVSQDFTYDTNTKNAVFEDQKGTTEDYILTGEKTFHDEIKKFSRAEISVTLTIKKDSITVMGDHGTYDKASGIAKVWGNVLALSKMQQDTMFLTADTLVAINEQDDARDKLLAYNNVKIFKSDLQGKCDSMVYNTGDSTIFLYFDPILWSKGSQLKADSINLRLVNKKIERLYMIQNSFIISEDSTHNFNQLKGRDMTAYFKQSQLNRVDVNGNGESIYFMLDDKDSILIAMNKVICSDMVIRFTEKNKIERVSFITTPDGALIPPHEILEPEKRLKGFKWRIEEKPEREELIAVRAKASESATKKQGL